MRSVLWYDALRGRGRSSRRSALLVWVFAGALYGLVYVLRMHIEDPGTGVLNLLAFPVALLAISFGRWVGLGGAVAALGVVGVYDAQGGDVGGFVGYTSRGVVFLLLAWMLGDLLERLEAAQQERGRAQSELAEAQRVAGIGSWHWDASTDELRWSPEMFRIYGVEPPPGCKRATAALVVVPHPSLSPGVAAARARAMVDRRPFDLQERVVHPDGTVVETRTSGEVIVDDAGAVLGMRGTTQDMTSLRTAEHLVLESEQRLRAAIGGMLDAVAMASAVRDEHGRIVDFRIEYANDAAVALSGKSAEEMVGHTWREIWPGDNSGLFDDYVRLVEYGEPIEVTERIYDPTMLDSPVVGTFDVRASQLGDGYIVVWRDVSERARTQDELRRAAERFTAAFERAPVGMALISTDGVIAQANQALAAMTGYHVDELAGTSLTELTDPRDFDADAEQLGDLLAGRTAGYRLEKRLLDVDGRPLWVSFSAGIVHGNDELPAYLVAHVEDVSERKTYETRLQYLADHDPLTGLFNRRRFDQELSHHLTLDARYGGGGAVLLLDLDNFKYVNDTLGHGTGDALIRAIAHVLHERVRDSDVLARLGGDEFALLLPAADAKQAAAVARGLLDAIRSDSAVEYAGWRARTTVSVGIVMLTPSEDSAEIVLSNADLAMYAAKEEGRDRFAFFDPGGAHQARTEARFRWLDRVHTALEYDQFTLQAQPILDLGTGAVTHVELLLRMREGDHLVSPGRFLYIAERHGLARSIDRWVVRRAVQLAASDVVPDSVRVEVNLSGDSLGDTELPALIEAELDRHGVDPRQLVFEVTETAAVANMEEARRFVEKVTDLGCSFALDDFGAGFGSFYYLKHLPFDYLKIDGEFVRQLTSSRPDQVIVEAMVAIARRLGKQTIAEYVGDEQTVSLLRSYGVDYAQGYHVGRPTRIEDAVSSCVRGTRVANPAG